MAQEPYRPKINLVAYEANQVIFSAGEHGDTMYVVKEGEVELVVGGTVVETVGADGIFGEMALVDDLPRSATARAKTACKVNPINEREFQYMVDETPFFALRVMRILAKRLRAMNERRG